MAVAIRVVQPVMDVRIIVQQIVNVPVPEDVIEIVSAAVKHRVRGTVIRLASLSVERLVLHKELMLPRMIRTIKPITHRIHRLLEVEAVRIALIHVLLHVKMDVKQHAKEVVKEIANQVVKVDVIRDAKKPVIVGVKEVAILVAKGIAKEDVLDPAKQDVQVAQGLVIQDAIILA